MQFAKGHERNNESFGYQASYLVELKIIKTSEWNRYSKVGTMTVSGIKFLESTLSSANPIE